MARRKAGIKLNVALHPKAAVASTFTLSAAFQRQPRASQNSPLTPLKGLQAGEPIDRRC